LVVEVLVEVLPGQVVVVPEACFGGLKPYHLVSNTRSSLAQEE
jgi:hypothetical protein